MVTVTGNTPTGIQILNGPYFTYRIYSGKRYTSNYSSFSYWKIAGQTRLFKLGMATDLRKRKF